MRVVVLGWFLIVTSGCTQPKSFGTSGEETYAATCQTCHGEDGLGVNAAFPPLMGSPWLRLPDAHLIRLTLRGLQGPITVHERVYDNVMPPHAFLTDAQLAGVLNYVRAEYGSEDAPILGAILDHQVAAERGDFGQGPMWTIGELVATAQ